VGHSELRVTIQSVAPFDFPFVDSALRMEGSNRACQVPASQPSAVARIHTRVRPVIGLAAFGVAHGPTITTTTDQMPEM
jgi:hypothetical protein